MKIKLFITILLLIFITPLLSSEKIIIDNIHIQEYNGITGKWFNVTSASKLKELIETCGSDSETFKKLNPIVKFASNSYLFIPFSDDYIARLQSENNGRTERNLETREFIWPLYSINRISSLLGQRWGAFHPGVDLSSPVGTPIIAVLDGKVISSKYVPGYGNVIILEHRDSLETRYAHNSVNFVKHGEYVRKGQIIGLVGNTGRSTGPHLHFEVRINDIPLDPLDFFPEDQDKADILEKISNQRR